MMEQVFWVFSFFNRRSKAGSSAITPDVLLMDSTSPWQPASFVSPTTAQQALDSFPTAHGVLAISAAAGAGGITFITIFIMMFTYFRRLLRRTLVQH